MDLDEETPNKVIDIIKELKSKKVALGLAMIRIR